MKQKENETQEKNKALSRRSFVKKAAVAGAGFYIVPRFVLGGKGYIPPSDKVYLGMVGVGGKGRQNTQAFLALPDVEVSAVADPAEFWDLKDFYYKSKAGRGPVTQLIEEHYKAQNPQFKVVQYRDFRKMLEKETGLDGIVCSTPDNTHAYVTLRALKSGKHVYCEKPLTHNIWEAREVAKATKESGLKTQMGNSLHSTEGIRKTVELLRDGAIGNVTEAHTFVPASRWNPSLKGLPKEASPGAEKIGWDLWLGPTSYLPYNDHYAPVKWRDFWVLGNGALGDFGCHDLDPAVWAFNLHNPSSVEVHPAGYSNKDIIPYGELGYYIYKADGIQPDFKHVWYSGGIKPPKPKELPRDTDLPSRGTLFIGDQGILVTESGGRNPKIYPETRRNEYRSPSPSIPRSNGHFKDWIDAIKNGSESSAHFEYGALLSELTLLGVLSLRLGGKKILWDKKEMKATNLPEADILLKEPVRDGWEMG